MSDEAVCSKYLAAGSKLNMTLEEAEALSRCVARRLAAEGHQADFAVGLANGALLPTSVVAETLGLPFHMVKVRRQGSRWIQRLQRVKEFLHVPSSLVTLGPLKLFWYWFQRRFNRLEKTDSSFNFEVAGKHVLLIDDCIVSGSSIRYVSDRLIEAGVASVRVGVICWSDDLKAINPANKIHPEVYLHRAVHFYPWSNSSPYLSTFMEWLRVRNLELWT